MKRYLSLATLLWGLPLLTPTAVAQWIESPQIIQPDSITKPDNKVEFLQFSELTATPTQAEALDQRSEILSERPQSISPTGGWLPSETNEMAQTFNRNLFVNQPWSYIGAGAGIGVNGNTQLSQGSAVVNAKIALNSSLSLRPAVWFANQVAITLPLSYDIHLSGSDPFEPARFHPFIGGGLIFTVDSDTSATDNAEDNVGPMLMGGMDVRLSDEWVFNTSANFGFIDDRTEIGIILGVGYVFSGI
ncbi:MAG: hypothetical protein F6J87_11760 [Spirulina sp. SIO3F2]|nr:hypothetical protein [Spirulina sp. SIO3F2]